MRILQLVTDCQLRGAQVFAAQLADWLHDQGHEVRILALYQSNQELLQAKVPVIRLSGVKKTFSRSLLAGVRKVFREFSPEVVQANGSDTLKYAVIAGFMVPRKPVIVYRNISMAGSWGRPGPQRWFYNWLFRNVDHVASLTARTRKEFVNVYHFPERKVSVIPIGTMTDHHPDRELGRQTLARATGASINSLFVMHVGAFSKEKNHIGLLRIFGQIKQKQPSSVLVLVGSGPIMDEIRKSAPDSVAFLGPRADVTSLLAGADLLLLPSLIEGLPGVILEAMASKVPVVAYRIGAIDEAVADGKSGYVVSLNDEDQFSARAIEILSSPDVRSQMGEASYQEVCRKFSLANVCREFETIYKDLVNKRR